MAFLRKVKRLIDWKVTLSWRKLRLWINVTKIICYDKAGKTRLQKKLAQKYSKKLGKNKTLEENCAKQFKEINFEFMSTWNSQKNGVIEWGFDTIYSCMGTMMEQSGLHENIKTGIWTKCAATSTKLENVMVNQHK